MPENFARKLPAKTGKREKQIGIDIEIKRKQL
jgi:hypothetical protein